MSPTNEVGNSKKTNEVGNKDPHMLMTYNVEDSSTLGEVKQLENQGGHFFVGSIWTS